MVTSVRVTSGTMLVGDKVIRMCQKAVAKRKTGYRRAQSSGTKAPCNRMLALLSLSPNSTTHSTQAKELSECRKRSLCRKKKSC